MSTINDIKKIDEKTIITIGNFDGLHKGHQELIKRSVSCAKNNNLKSVVFTFSNHPLNFFRPNSIKNIITNKEKINILKSFGVDIIINIVFNEDMTKISSYDFVEKTLVEKLNAKKIVVGHDFTFGRNKEGDVKTLIDLSKKFNFEVDVIEEINILKRRISSTYIRELIKDGYVDKINDYLGRNYNVSGKVIHARKIGRTIGFPTANMLVDESILIPKNGIYATKVFIKDKEFIGATNIGFNPTVNGKNLSIETNILDFDEDIYGEIIKIEFLERIRDEKKFSGIDELKKQLKKDVNFIRNKYIENIF